MRVLSMGALFFFVLTGLLRADEYEISKLREQWNAANQEWKDRVANAQDNNREVDSKLNPVYEFRSKFRLAAQRNIDNPKVLPLLTWMVMHQDPDAGDAQAKRDADWALAKIKSDFLRTPAIGEQLDSLAGCEQQMGADAAGEFLEQVSRDNPDRNVQAEALLQLAMLHQRLGMPDDNESGEGNPNKARLLMANKLLNTVRQVYPDSPAATRAAAFQKEFRNIQKGKTAPDIEGIDQHGKKIRLADYHGNVVVLIFWGSWSNESHAFVRRANRIADRMKNDPVAFLGINTDDNIAAMNAVLKQERIDWSNVFDGPRGKGKIAQQWNVSDAPRVYVIDRKGAIIRRNVTDPSSLNSLLGQLLKKEKLPKKSSGS